MENSDEETQSKDSEAQNKDSEAQNKDSLMEEAIKILNQEGFSLPGDVVDTLYTVGRSNAAARRRGALRAHKMSEFESKAKKIRNTRESSAKRNQERAAFSRESQERTNSTNNTTDQNGTAVSASSTAAASVNSAAKAEIDSSRESRLEKQGSDEVFTQATVDENSKAKLEREESTESSSTCSVSTVKEQQNNNSKKTIERQDSASSMESSASSMNKKKSGIGRLESVGSDTGYSTSMENVVQTREAKAENLKNMNKATADPKTLQKLNTGLRRDLSHDSGFTEQSCLSPAINQANEAQTLTTQDFNDVSISDSDVSERFISSDTGEAHVVTSAASDLTAAEMTSKGDAVTEDGTAVSSRARLENQEANSTLLRVTNKATDEEISKEDDYESVSQTSKSSRNDSISTTAAGQQTAASRHAASIEQGLYKERSKLATSQDGSRVAADMSVDQQLTRNQEMNNSEQVDDGTNKTETKKTTEKSLTSKSLREEKLVGEDGSIHGSVTSSQNMDSNLRCSELDETVTNADGSVTKRKDDNATSSMKETSSSEKKSVKQLPYGGGKSTEISKKTDNSSVSNVSKVQSERNESASGVSEKKHEEDSKAMSSSFSGVCESEDVINGQTMKRMQSSEQSSESKVKTSRSVSSYSSRGGGTGNDVAEIPTSGRRLSDSSDVSNFSSISKENINPPTYEETINNLSRQGSVGSVSSGYSRQDSCASSIASSAGAFNERQRQKRLEREGLCREDSYENETEAQYGRGRETMRQDSFSSDSTISAGNEYQGREIVHPIRKVDTNVYGRSLTDSSIGKKINRRATLQGDIVLSDHELRMAREDVRSSIRGRDDSFIDRSSSRQFASSGEGRRRDAFDSFGSFGSGSFKKDVMNMVDSFFDDDDGAFDMGFGRRRENRSFEDPLLSRRRNDNPYTMRDDLSKFRAEQEIVRAETSDLEYAASDSGYPKPSSRRRLELENDFTDTASDSGHNRFAASRREADDFNYGKNFGKSDSRASHRVSSDNDYQYSHLSNRVSAISADDISQSAGKSIQRDRGMNTSISDSCENITRSRINNNSFDNRNNVNYTRDGDYTKYREPEMSVSSTVHSVSQEVRNRRPSDSEDYKSRSLPNVNKDDGGMRYTQKQVIHTEEETEQWNDRRHRIDKALSWIRGELMHIEPTQGVLRTQDKVLMSQFQRCQDSIEELKKQKPWYDIYSDDDDDDDDYEDNGRHWEDWEIDEFERRDTQQNDLRSSLLNNDVRRGYNSSSKTSYRPTAVYTKQSQRVSMTTIE